MKGQIKTNILACIILLLPGLLRGQSRVQSGPEQDCIHALPICGISFSQPNQYRGSGANSHELNSSATCLTSGEVNSVWYTFTCATSGVLQFIITPLTTDDYDFALFNLTGHSCADISTGVAPEVRCNYASTIGITTGIGHGGTDTISPPGGSPFNSSLNVNAGETFALLVNNFTFPNGGYTIDFSGSTTNIADTTRPYISAVDSSVICDPTDSIILHFSRPMLCDSILLNGSQFSITGPSTVSVIRATNNNYYTSSYTTGIVLHLNSPISIAGTYAVHFHAGSAGGRIVDLCQNEVHDTIVPYIQKNVLQPYFTDSIVRAGNADTVFFYNQPNPFDSIYDWNFGDHTDTAFIYPHVSNTWHVYPDSGSYTVTLRDTAGNCTASFSKVIVLTHPDTTGINNVSINEPLLTLYPNPATNSISLSSTGNIETYSVFNPEGQKITGKENIHSQQTIIDLQGWAKGIYILQATIGKQTIIKRFTVL